MNQLEQLEITQHPKRQADVRALLDEVRHSPFIGEITAQEIARLRRAGTVRFFYVGDVLAGLAGWEMIGKHWVELGPFYTAQAYRGQGLGSVMFDTIEHIHLDAGHALYAVTKNPLVKQMFAKRGFRQVGTWALPRELQIYLLRKLSLRKVLHHLRKLRPGDSVSHFIKLNEQTDT